MKIVNLTNKNHQEVISLTLSVLKSGGLVVFPSDTVYGLLVDSTNPAAIDKLLFFKDRPVGKAISVFVANEKMTRDYVEINQNAKNVIKNLLPGPFTVICDSKHKTDPRLEAENGTLGFRIPDFPLITQLVTKFGMPITATSANISSKPPVHSISVLLKTLSQRKKDAVNLIVDAGILPKNNPSTVIDTTTGQLKTLRIGDLLPKTANTFISKSESETRKLARFLLTKLIKKTSGKPLMFLLEGNLGTGKTIFAKGLGKALGIKQIISSPTFNISNEYKIDSPTKLLTTISSLNSQPVSFDIKESSPKTSKDNVEPVKFVHYDLFRIESREELKEINILEQISCGNIYAVEWPERLPAEIISALKKVAEIVYIKIKSLSETEREIKWSN